MAVVVSIARGHDASYPFKTIGRADGATLTGGAAPVSVMADPRQPGYLPAMGDPGAGRARSRTRRR